MNVRDIPRLKVDLMVDQDGKFKIAEIDGHNKHGVGYWPRQACPQARARSGSAGRRFVSLTEMSRLGHESSSFSADQERFYVPEFEIVRSEFESSASAVR